MAGTISLRMRFGEILSELAERIEATRDIAQLDEWLDRFVTAQSLDEIDI